LEIAHLTSEAGQIFARPRSND